MFNTLDRVDVCIQPLEDKGYGAIGMRKSVDLFSEIKNFRSHSDQYNLIQETKQLCQNKNISLHIAPEELFDIDNEKDLRRLLRMKDFWEANSMRDLYQQFQTYL